MEKYTVKFSELAVKDLKNLYAYLSDNFIEEKQAEKYISKIVNRIDQLAITPKMGPLANERLPEPLSLDHNYRLLFIAPYVAVYYIEHTDNSVAVIRIFHQKQDFPNLF